MSSLEFYVKFKIQTGQLDKFKQRAGAITDAARRTGGKTLRCDWFISDEKSESVAMTVYENEGAMQLHHQSAGAHYAALTEWCEGWLEFFGAASVAAQAAMAKFNPRVLSFAYGINPGTTPMHAALAADPTRQGIEVYTRFDIFPEHAEDIKAVGAELIPIVRSKDPGTTRYDWFYDDAGTQGVAMDAYADPRCMFAHMKNAHDVHEKLFEHCTMKTEFLGELPADAKAAVARYDPYILPLYCGLNKVPQV